MNPDFLEKFHTPFKATSWSKCNPDDDVQSFEDFMETHKRGFKRSFPNGSKQNIVLVCFDKGIKDEIMTVVAEFVSIYFHLKTIWIRNHLDLDSKKQITVEPLTTILQKMRGSRDHRDTFCILGITSNDLTAEGMNFIYGVALSNAKVGVVSFKRYTDPKKKYIVLKDALSVVVHEIGHLFDLTHCTTFKCVMNGSNNLVDFRSHPLSLCPICSKKMSYALSDPAIHVNFYQHCLDLSEFYNTYEMQTEYQWMQKILQEYSAPHHYDGEKTSCTLRAERQLICLRNLKRIN